MICCFAFAHCDADLALQNALWMAELKIGKGHEALAICNLEAREKGLHEPVIEALRKTFPQVHVTFCTEDERLWPEKQRKWPWVQNLTFSSAARYVRANLRKPWLFLEADAFFLCEGGLDQIEGEYHYSNQPFMGMFVDTVGDDGVKIPQHMSGIGVYPSDLARWTDKALQGGGTAFDMVLRDATVPNMHQTRLIHHVYKAESFPDQESLRRIQQGAVIFHQNKDGSLVDRLRERQGLPLFRPSSAIANAPTALPASTRPMTTDIFIKAYPKDYPWLRYCLKSIRKFATGFRKVVVIAPNAEWVDPTTDGDLVRSYIPDQEPGYLFQQSVKLHAYRYSDADQFLFMDCDCVFTQPVTPQTFMVDGKPIWLKTPWKDVNDINARDSWIPAMLNWFGATPQFEYMRRHPFLIPRFLLEAMLQHTHLMHAKPLDEYIMGCENFSEFNCAGYLADMKFRDKFHWIDTSRQQSPEPVVRQFYSHDGVDAHREEIEAILNKTHPVTATEVNTPSNKPHPFEPLIQPMEELYKNMAEKAAIEVLASEASKSPLHKARLAKKLVAAGVISEPKKKGKR